MATRRTLFTEILLCSVLTVGIASALAQGSSQDTIKAASCVSNVKQEGLAMIMYASDYDDFFPRKANWMDNIFPYSKNKSILHCPSVAPNQFGYAYNSAVAGKNAAKIASPATDPMVFDSKLLGRSTVSTIASVPKPGRHLGKNSIGYVDGHVKAVAPK